MVGNASFYLFTLRVMGINNLAKAMYMFALLLSFSCYYGTCVDFHLNIRIVSYCECELEFSSFFRDIDRYWEIK